MRRIKEWHGPKGEWRWQVSDEPVGRMMKGVEFAAFIYNVTHGIQLNTSSILSIHNNNSSSAMNKSSSTIVRKPYLGCFTAGDMSFVLVCLHVKTRVNREILEEEEDDEEELCVVNGNTQHNNDGEVNEDEEQEALLPESGEMYTNNRKRRKKIFEKSTKHSFDISSLNPVVSSLCDRLSNEKDIVLLGDFSFPPSERVFDVLREAMYSHVVPCDTSTNYISGNKNIFTAECYDNIWISESLMSNRYTGK